MNVTWRYWSSNTSGKPSNVVLVSDTATGPMGAFGKELILVSKRGAAIG